MYACVSQLKHEVQQKSTAQAGEVASVNKLLAETKARSREVEQSLRDEAASLKRTIADLQTRLGLV